MKSVTISMRLPESEVRRLEEQAQQMRIEKPVFLKRALRRGAQDLGFERAVEAYRSGEATLSRAAEMAGLRQREMMLMMESSGLELNYGARDLVQDLER